jgi:hypothetical protein
LTTTKEQKEWIESQNSRHTDDKNDLGQKNITYGLVLLGVPEHHPAWDSGQRSVTLTTMLFVTAGKNGGVGVYVFKSVRRKHLPQPGPYAALLPYAIWLRAAVG